MTMRERTDERGTMGTVGDWTELLVPFDGSRGAEKVLRRACRAEDIARMVDPVVRAVPGSRGRSQ